MPKQTRQHLIQKANGIHYFRMRIPADIAKWFPKKEICRSLHTRQWRTAVQAATLQETKALKLFERLRSGMLSPDEMRALVDRYRTHWLDGNEARRHGPLYDEYLAAQQNMLRQGILDDLVKEKQDLITGFDKDALVAAAQCLIDTLKLPDAVYDRATLEKLGYMKVRADLNILEIERRRAGGDYDNEHDRKKHTQASAATEAAEPASPSIRELTAQYRAEKQSGGSWSAKTEEMAMSSLGFLTDYYGEETPITMFTHAKLTEFRNDVLMRLPRNRKKNKRYAGKNIKQILKMKKVTPMAAATVRKRMSVIASFFKWCARHDYLTKNPADGLIPRAKRGKKSKERDRFSVEEIQTLCAAVAASAKAEKRWQSHPEYFWVTLLAIYTGMRQNEICQLYVDDIIEVDGIWCIDINWNTEDKKGKSDSAERTVPIHPHLIEIGFLQYVEQMRKAKAPRLWMQLKQARDGYGRAISRWFASYKADKVTDDNKKVFHSLRHTFTDELKQNGVQEVLIAELVGHSNSSQTTGRYGKAFRPEPLLDALGSLDFGLDLDKLGDAAQIYGGL